MSNFSVHNYYVQSCLQPCLSPNITSKFPFEGKDLFKRIRLGEFRFDTKYWAVISDEVMDLIKRLIRHPAQWQKMPWSLNGY